MKILRKIGSIKDTVSMMNYLCLNCHRGFEAPEDLELNYCPLCGADARGNE